MKQHEFTNTARRAVPLRQLSLLFGFDAITVRY